MKLNTLQDRPKAEASAFPFGRKNCHLKSSGAIGILAGGDPGKCAAQCGKADADTILFDD